MGKEDKIATSDGGSEEGPAPTGRRGGRSPKRSKEVAKYKEEKKERRGTKARTSDNRDGTSQWPKRLEHERARTCARERRTTKPAVVSAAGTDYLSDRKKRSENRHRTRISRDSLPDAADSELDPTIDANAVEAEDVNVEAVKDEDNTRVNELEAENESLRRKMEKIENDAHGNQCNGKRNSIFALIILLLLTGGGVAAFVLKQQSNNSESSASSTGIISDTTGSPSPDPSDLLSNIPNESPTNPPSLALKFFPPDEGTCTAIQNGEPVPSQDEMLVRVVDMSFDVSTQSEQTESEEEASSDLLLEAINDRLIPGLVGCGVSRRLSNVGGLRKHDTHSSPLIRFLQESPLRYVVASGVAILSNRSTRESCDARAPAPCYRIVAKFTLFLKGQEGQVTTPELTFLLSSILDSRVENLASVENLGLESSTFARVVVAALRIVDATLSPSDYPSMNPSEASSPMPSATPSEAPSPAPSATPSTTVPATEPLLSDDTDCSSSSQCLSGCCARNPVVPNQQVCKPVKSLNLCL